MDKKKDMTDYWRKARGEKITPNERQLLFNLAQKVADDFEHPTIVNIGVSWGASLHCLVAGAPNANHIAIDIDYDKRPVVGKELLNGIKFLHFDSSRIRVYESIHLVFVDGCHSYKCVKADAENFTPHIPVGGMIAFHDYMPEPRDRKRLEGVERAVDEWLRANIDWIRIATCDSIVVFERVR